MKVNSMIDVPIREKQELTRSVISSSWSCFGVNTCVIVVFRIPQSG